MPYAKMQLPRNIVEHIPPPPKLEKEDISAMMGEEPGDPKDSCPAQIIESILIDLESDGLELVVAPPKAGEKEEEINKIAARKSQDEGHKESEQEFVEGDHE